MAIWIVLPAPVQRVVNHNPPVSAGLPDNRNQQAALLVADQLTHKDDSYEDQDNERKKR